MKVFRPFAYQKALIKFSVEMVILTKESNAMMDSIHKMEMVVIGFVKLNTDGFADPVMTTFTEEFLIVVFLQILLVLLNNHNHD